MWCNGARNEKVVKMGKLRAISKGWTSLRDTINTTTGKGYEWDPLWKCEIISTKSMLYNIGKSK